MRSVKTQLKVPSFQLKITKSDNSVYISHPSEPQTSKPRSISAHNSFRAVFRAPKRIHNQNQGRFNPKIKADLQNSLIIKSSPISSQYENLNDLQYLSHLCQKMVKKQDDLKRKIEQQNTFLARHNANTPSPYFIPKLSSLSPDKFSQMPLPMKSDCSKEGLVTFRPSYNPQRKQFRFPREIFK
ncbi:hypothetical protein SteCoe_8749 [Stentor coeruleus]|uniref:Uncharacterized protein n=1 Tax=Stentor coeruleus TaxID=5963 RepID=A0A1R2CJB0_9CILI|nr:hypothetical protein SteCoe_8749 [Stentor coeruleus]